MATGVDIRLITRNDHIVWRELWSAYLDFYDTHLPETVFETTWERLLSREPYEPRGFLAWRNNETVGLTHYYFHRSCWSIENICYLQDIFVEPALRGSGAGRALIEAVYTQQQIKKIARTSIG